MTQKKCPRCKHEIQGTFKCNNCGTEFCYWCNDPVATRDGAIREVKSRCPECDGSDFTQDSSDP